MTDKKYCKDCQHVRIPTPPEPFSVSDGANPAVGKPINEWKKQRDERVRREYDMYCSHKRFTFKPWFYAWCDHFSKLGEKPRTPMGNEIEIYELIDWHNTNHDCAAFKSRSGDGR